MWTEQGVFSLELRPVPAPVCIPIYDSIFLCLRLEPFPLPASCLLSCHWAKSLWMSVTGCDSRAEGWCFKCSFSSGCIDFSPLHSVTAKCSRQKSSRTGSQSCSWGQTGHRSLYWHVGHISQMTGAQAERPKWLWSEVGGLLHRPLTADSLQQSRHRLDLVSFRIIILALFFLIITSLMRKMKVSENWVNWAIVYNWAYLFHACQFSCERWFYILDYSCALDSINSYFSVTFIHSRNSRSECYRKSYCPVIFKWPFRV